jgi:alkylation response protein AidB-like acyl-CoA dehydrogenase
MFEPTDDQRALREAAREFAERAIRPRAIDLDRRAQYPAEILDELGERGWTGLTLPEAYGGKGGNLVELTILVEELSAALMPVASALALHLGVATVVERFGTDEQRERWLPEMARFERVGALGLSEQHAGSDKSGMEATATKVGDEWLLDGHKRWVTNYLHADEVLVYARDDPEAAFPDGVTAFLVPTEEFVVEEVWDTTGARPVKSPQVRLDGVRVTDDRRVGPVGEAYRQRGTLSTGVNVPARGVGIARAALEDTVGYTAEREQGGSAIGDRQGVRWRTGEMATRVETARLLTLRAADLADRGEDHRHEFAMAKVAATEAAVENANEAMQLHGGIGYTTEKHVERYLRDARLLTLAGGPNEGHRDTLGETTFERYRRD